MELAVAVRACDFRSKRYEIYKHLLAILAGTATQARNLELAASPDAGGFVIRIQGHLEVPVRIFPHPTSDERMPKFSDPDPILFRNFWMRIRSCFEASHQKIRKLLFAY